jgi:hypothetical protein
MRSGETVGDLRKRRRGRFLQVRGWYGLSGDVGGGGGGGGGGS